ncbi:MAG: hypothetical protein HQ522_03775 [Bacteroidetes bacterium]|nr:hypothetical protein [Bacteroidota bacterium]
MLFKTIAEIKTFLPIGVGNDFNRLKPHIANAENKYIKSLLGDVMYDELEEFYDALPIAEPTEVQEAMQSLLEKVQHSLIHLAYFVGYDFLNISATDAGFQRLETEHKKGLYKYQEDNLKQYFSDAGFNSLDTILVFIENNIQHFSEFKATANWTEIKESFLPTVSIVEKIPFNLFGSRLTFLNLKPHISFVEDTTIKFVLGDTIYQEIKTGMIADQVPAKITAILPYIRKPLIYLASALLMEETGATLGNNGLYFEKRTGNYPDNKLIQPSTEERILSLAARNRFIGNAYLDALKSFLATNISDWETFEIPTNPILNRDNTGKKTFWA